MNGIYETLGNHLSPGVDGELATDALMPTQYRDLRTSKAVPAEKRLLIFVLKQAMDDYAHPELASARPAKRGKIRAEVRAWIESDENRRVGAFTFVALCDGLGLDVRATREKLERQMKEIDAGGNYEGWDFMIPVPTVGAIAA